MILLIRALCKTRFAEKHREIAALPAALAPVPGYYLYAFARNVIQNSGKNAFFLAAGTLKKDLLQAAGSMLVFILLYDMVEGFRQSKNAKEKLDKK